jgi:hypothetical protein
MLIIVPCGPKTIVNMVPPIICHVLAPPAAGNSTICTIKTTALEMAINATKDFLRVNLAPLQAQIRNSAATTNIAAHI